MLYTKVATARILDCDVSLILNVQIWVNVIWVQIKGQRPRFVSKKSYQEDFFIFRHKGAEGVDISNLKKYQTTIMGCQCGDYNGQKRDIFFLKKEVPGFTPRCKHMMKFSSLEEMWWEEQEARHREEQEARYQYQDCSSW